MSYAGSTKDKLTKEELLKNDSFIEDAGLFLIDRGGYDADDIKDPNDLYDAYMEHFRYQNVNELTASRDLIYAQSADEETKQRMGRLMNTFDRMDSDLGWEAAGDYLAGVFTAPSTYAGIFSFGAGKAGALAANQGVKFGIRQAIKSGGLKAATGSAAVDAVASAGTIAAQEQTRVETMDAKDEIDWSNVGTGAAISLVASGGTGLYTGARREMLSYGAEKITVETLKKEKANIVKANKGATAEVFGAKSVKGMSDKEAAEVINSAKNFKSKLSLKKTIPEFLEKGKALKKEKADEFGVSSKGLGISIDEQHIENIAAAGARVLHLIEPRKVDVKNPKLGEDVQRQVKKGSKEDLKERFTSKVARALSSGDLPINKFNKVLDEHNVSVEEFGYLFAEEVSRSARLLGSLSKTKRELKRATAEQKTMQKDLMSLDSSLQDFGDATSKAKDRVKKELGIDIMGSTYKVIQHLDKARIGMMTVQLATTARNTTNGLMRNYVYAFDNLGAGLYNVAVNKTRQALDKSNILKITDAEIKKTVNENARAGQMQLRNAFRASVLDDLRLGTGNVRTQGLYRLFTDERFGKSDMAKEMFREMGDIGNLTSTEGGLIGVARFLNGLNTKSDNMFKRAVFSRELDVEVYKKYGRSLEDVLKAGEFKNIDKDLIASAMNTAMDFTYQTGKFRGKPGGFNMLADGFIKLFSQPGLSMIAPFPRYLVNQFRFIYEHTPVLGLMNWGGILNKTSKTTADGAERFGKQLGGLATLYTMMQLRTNHGTENTGPFEYNTPQIGPLKSNGFYDARASLGPFSGFAVMGDILYRLMPNMDETTYKIKIPSTDVEIDTFIKQNPRLAKDVGYSSRDLIYSITGGQGRGGTGLRGIEKFLDILVNGIDSGFSKEQIKRDAVVAAADFVNTFTVGAGVIKDLVATVDPDFRKIPDNTDVSLMGYFMKQATRSFPQTTEEDKNELLGTTFGDGIFYNVGPKRTGISESPTRQGGRTYTNPLLKVFTGLSEQEEKNRAEKELKRLNIDFYEYSPRQIRLDESLGNKARGYMGKFVEDSVTSYLYDDEYIDIPSDFEKKVNLKIKLSKFKAMARASVLDPKTAIDEEEVDRIHRAMFFNLPTKTQKFLNYRYKDLLRSEDGWDGNPTDVISGNISKDRAFVFAIGILEKLKKSDTKLYEFYTRPK